MELDAARNRGAKRPVRRMSAMQAARALGEGLHHPIRRPADAGGDR